MLVVSIFGIIFILFLVLLLIFGGNDPEVEHLNELVGYMKQEQKKLLDIMEEDMNDPCKHDYKPIREEDVHTVFKCKKCNKEIKILTEFVTKKFRYNG